MATKFKILILFLMLVAFAIGQKFDVLEKTYVIPEEYDQAWMKKYVNDMQLKIQGLESRLELLENRQ